MWWRVFNTVSGIAEVTRYVREARRRAPPGEVEPTDPGPATWGPRSIETRLIGVVVGALQEAFNRDRARLDLEREHVDAERARAEMVLRLELKRQAGDRALAQIRLMAVMSVAIWLASALLVPWLPGAREAAARILLGAGWAALIAGLVSAFLAHTRVDAWLADARATDVAVGGVRGTPGRLLPWLFLFGLCCVAASVIAAL